MTECNPHKPVYGVQLEEHLRVTGRDIALVIEACVCTLIEGGLEEEVGCSFKRILHLHMHLQK